MSAIAVIIVNFNAGHHLEACVESVAADLGVRDWEIIVVDNASSDHSADRVALQPRLRLVRNAENRGFGAAVNQAAAMTEAKPRSTALVQTHGAATISCTLRRT